MRRTILLSSVLAAILCAAPVAAQSNAEGERVVKQMFDEAWSAGRYESLPTMLAPDFRFHFRGRTNPMQAEQFRGMVEMWRTVLPDLRFTIHEIVSSGDVVSARMTFTGTHRGAIWGIEPTGRTVTVSMMGFFRFADGRVREMWEDYDEHGLRQQLTRPAS